MKKLLYSLVSLFLLLMQTSAYATYDVLFENNTPYKLYINTGSSSSLADKYFGGWHGQTIDAYGRDKVQWFNFNNGIKFGESYSFFVEVRRNPNAEKPTLIFETIIKGFVYGSSVVSTIVKSGSDEREFWHNDPKPYFSKLKSENFQNLLGDHKPLAVRADAIKYSLPNPHKNVQFTDAISYVVSEQQPQYKTSDLKNEISLLSYNIQVWPMYAKAGGIILNKPEQRVLDIAKKVSQYDVVALQEVFSKDHRDSLTHAMADNFPFHAGPSYGNRPLSSGVVIYSRWPLLASDTMVYSHCADVDCAAAKGVSYAKIDKYGQAYHIFATHFQAGSQSIKSKQTFGELDVMARMQQIHELKSFIDSKHIAKDEAIIISGDLNIDALACTSKNKCKEFNHLTESLGVDYIAHDNKSTLPFTVNGNINWMSSNTDIAILDYIFYMKNYRLPKSYHSRVLILRGDDDSEMYTGSPYGDTELSDHFAIEAKLVF